MALVKELTEQDGVYYLRGAKFSGTAFRKNEKGKFITEEPFRKGLLHGKRINYNTKGSPIAKEKFKNGNGTYKTYYSNSRLKSEGEINKSIKYGEWVYYDKKGILKAKEFWSYQISNQLDWEKYYNKLGVLESEMFYKLGILSKEVYYDANGKIFKTNKN
jgi:antitoxin component YwqK of YwqJK toxin-antitoxin module